jgi:hypothetical protein
MRNIYQESTINFWICISYSETLVSFIKNRIGCAMDSMFASSRAVWSCQTNNYVRIIIWKSKDRFAQNQDNVSKRRDMFTRGHLFQWAMRVGLIQTRLYYHPIDGNFFSPWYNLRIAHLPLNNNYSLALLHNTVVVMVVW